MYLTVFKMTNDSVLNAKKHVNINNADAMHRLLTGCQNAHRADGKILYRIIRSQNEMYLYIQTLSPLNRRDIEDIGFVFLKEMSIDYDDISGWYSFSTQVYPCICKGDKRFFIKDVEERKNWLIKQFAKHGIRLASDQFTEYGVHQIAVHKPNTNRIETLTASYFGKLYIDDPVKAAKMFEDGLGRMKNYGMGLVLIK